MTMLIVLSGLPCTGKSTLSRGIAKELDIPVYSVDPIEAAIWRGGIAPGHETGLAAYLVAEALAAEQLKLGHSAIVDAVNPIELSREAWRKLAAAYDARLIVIETVCSDPVLHRERAEKRVRNIPGMVEITWERVEQVREYYEPWRQDRLVLDSVQDAGQLVKLAVNYVREIGR